MATGKKSFVLYADLLTSVDHLTEEELGRLFKHILLYVNDKNPVLEDRLLLTAWKPIERTLKEDLKKWEKQLKQRSEAGKKSAESRKRKSTSVNDRQRASTDSVSVSVTDNDIPTISEFVAYALDKTPNVDVEAVRLKYHSWIENKWCINRGGKFTKIKNWKTSLLNTLPYLPKQQKTEVKSDVNMDYIKQQMKLNGNIK